MFTCECVPSKGFLIILGSPCIVLLSTLHSDLCTGALVLCEHFSLTLLESFAMHSLKILGYRLTGVKEAIRILCVNDSSNIFLCWDILSDEPDVIIALTFSHQ
jgi:hypothetical protein